MAAAISRILSLPVLALISTAVWAAPYSTARTPAAKTSVSEFVIDVSMPLQQAHGSLRRRALSPLSDVRSPRARRTRQCVPWDLQRERVMGVKLTQPWLRDRKSV